MQNKSSHTQGGFAIVEMALIIVIIAAIAGVGFWVYQQRSNSLADESTPAQSQNVDKRQAAAQSIANEIQKSDQEENKQTKSTGDSEVDVAQGDASAASSLGDN